MSESPRNPPFRAEHIGSLLRPEELIRQRYLIADGKAPASSLPPIEQASIKDIVKLQQECGFKGITNGEHSRHQFWGTFFETLDGMEEVNLREGGYDTSIFRMYAPGECHGILLRIGGLALNINSLADVNTYITEKHIPNAVCLAVGPIRHTGKSTILPEFEFLKTLVPSSQWGDIKLTLPSPSWYHLRYGPGRAYLKGVYEGDEPYFADVAKAYQVELGLLYEAGARNVQVDDPNLACE